MACPTCSQTKLISSGFGVGSGVGWGVTGGSLGLGSGGRSPGMSAGCEAGGEVEQASGGRENGRRNSGPPGFCLLISADKVHNGRENCCPKQPCLGSWGSGAHCTAFRPEPEDTNTLFAPH